MGLPMSSPSPKPSRRSAALLTKVARPSRSTPMMPSPAESRVRRVRSSASRRSTASRASLRFQMTITVRMAATTTQTAPTMLPTSVQSIVRSKRTLTQRLTISAFSASVMAARARLRGGISSGQSGRTANAKRIL